MIQQTYLQIRETIRNGDCILWQSRGIVPWIIQRFTAYSHASLCVRFDAPGMTDRVYMVEALSGGLKFTLLSERIAGMRGRAYLFQPSCLWGVNQERIRADTMTALSMGIKYDYKGLFGNLFGRVSEDAKRYFCSELVWAKWRKSGLLGNGCLTDAGKIALERNRAARPGDLPAWVMGRTFEIIKEPKR